MIAFDTETYRNYFLFDSKHSKTGKYYTTEFDGYASGQQLDELERYLKSSTFFGFNNDKFDNWVLGMVFAGFSSEKIWEIVQECIVDKEPMWRLARQYGFKKYENFDNFDVMALCPKDQGDGSAHTPGLKVYAARLNAELLESLPVNPEKYLTENDKDDVFDYCRYGDIEATLCLWRDDYIQAQYQARLILGEELGFDVRSKNSPQLAETYIYEMTCRTDKRRYGKPKPRREGHFLDRQDYIRKYGSPQLVKIYEQTVSDTFRSKTERGGWVVPDYLHKFNFHGLYVKMGVGGLHSVDGAASFIANNAYRIRDLDVVSYYPTNAIALGMYPRNLSPTARIIYEGVFKRRLEAKGKLKALGGAATKDEVSHLKAQIEAFKLILNSFFGKTGEVKSLVYDPDYFLTTTIGGQFALLLLIEMLHFEGIDVVSANTDGIMTYSHAEDDEALKRVWRKWEKITGLALEETEYKAVYRQNVNWYFAVKEDSVKRKGSAYGEQGIHLNPNFQAIPKAISDFLSGKCSIRESIRNNDKIGDFCMTGKAHGEGASYCGTPVGTRIRFYKSLKGRGTHFEKISPNVNGIFAKVPKTDNTYPAQELSKVDWDDIDYEWYIREAYDALYRIHYYEPDEWANRKERNAAAKASAGVEAK